MKFLQFGFLPTNVNLGLLVLRLWLGLTLLVVHGLAKVQNFAEMSGKFPGVFGMDSKMALSLAIFAEVICAGLVVLGLFTRLAALIAGSTMAVAFFVVHKGAFTGPASGELAFMYLGGFLTLLIAGAGAYSVDRK